MQKQEKMQKLDTMLRYDCVKGIYFEKFQKKMGKIICNPFKQKQWKNYRKSFK